MPNADFDRILLLQLERSYERLEDEIKEIESPCDCARNFSEVEWDVMDTRADLGQLETRIELLERENQDLKTRLENLEARFGQKLVEESHPTAIRGKDFL